jgi:hypothetical protein
VLAVAGLVWLLAACSAPARSALDGDYAVAGRVTRCVGMTRGCVRAEHPVGRWRLDSCDSDHCTLTALTPPGQWVGPVQLTRVDGSWLGVAERGGNAAVHCQGVPLATYDQIVLTPDQGGRTLSGEMGTDLTDIAPALAGMTPHTDSGTGFSGPRTKEGTRPCQRPRSRSTITLWPAAS